MRLRSFFLATTVFTLVSGAAADDLSFTVTPTRDLYDVVFAFAYDSSSLFGAGSLSLNYIQVTKGSKHLDAGVPTSLSLPYTNSFSLPIVAYTVLGKYDDSLGSGATVGYSEAAGDALIAASASWPFDSASPYGTVSESTFLTSLTGSLNADQLDIVFRRIIKEGESAAPGSDARLVNFSDATNGGTVTNVQAVPEPVTLMALAGGLVALRRRGA